MRNTGFTAMELLIVFAIIFTLVGIGIPAYNSWKNRSKIEKAKAIISKLEMALEMYKTDFGEYPTSLGKLKEAEASGKGPYIDNKDYKNNNFYDPWDKVIEYSYEEDTDTVTLISYGPNKEKGGGDDISNIGYGD